MKHHEDGREEAADGQEQHGGAPCADHLADDCATPAAAEPCRRRGVGEGLLSATGLAHGKRASGTSFSLGSSVRRGHQSWRRRRLRCVGGESWMESWSRCWPLPQRRREWGWVCVCLGAGRWELSQRYNIGRLSMVVGLVLIERRKRLFSSVCFDFYQKAFRIISSSSQFRSSHRIHETTTTMVNSVLLKRCHKSKVSVSVHHTCEMR